MKDRELSGRRRGGGAGKEDRGRRQDLTGGRGAGGTKQTARGREGLGPGAGKSPI